MDFSIAEREVKEAEEVKEVKDLPPHPRCFCRRVCKLLKRKDGRTKKSCKRDEECASARKERGSHRATETLRRKNLEHIRRRGTPRRFCMDVKRKRLPAKSPAGRREKGL
jgi:hypothetical protein